MEVCDRKSTESLDYGILSATEQCLILLIVETEVANHHNGLMEEFFAVLLLVRCFHCIVEDVVEEVIKLLLGLKIAQDLLSESVVHAEYVVNNLY